MTATATATVIRTPYRGLAPYGDGDVDALTFFGRNRDTEIVVANLLASRLTVLYGPSGVGKTSLLRAGVARRVRHLAEGRGPDSRPDAAIVVFASWSGDAAAKLAADVGDTVRSLVAGDPPEPPPHGSLADVLEHWSAVLDGEIFLVLDQFEEQFVYHGAEAGPGTVVGELPEVILRSGLRVHVLLSLRDDALAQLDVLNGAVPGLFANVIRLDRLDRASARAAIVGPVQAYDDLAPPYERVAVQPELVDSVLNETRASDGRIEAPYLQLVMERVWDEERRRGSRELRDATLAELGSAAQIVREHLDGALASLDGKQQDIAARMFEHLVTPSGTKIAHRSMDLARFARVPSVDAAAVLQRLADERIVRTLDDPAGESTRYEIFHDVLADAILDWSRRRDIERERDAARRHKRRLVAVAVASAVALLVMAAITVFALVQRSDARSQERAARARAYAAAALANLPRDPELSLLLARRSAALRTSPQIEDVLRKSLIASRVRRVIRLGAPGTAALFTAQGSLVAVTKTGRVVLVLPSGMVQRSFTTHSPRTLLDPTGVDVFAYGRGRPPRLYPVSSGTARRLPTRPVAGAVFSQDGRVLVTMDSGRLLHVWDAQTGRLAQVLEAARPPRIAGVSADDALLAVASGGRSVEIFSLADGTRVRTLAEPRAVTRIAFSPTAPLVALAEDDTMSLRNARTGARFPAYTGHVGPITDIAFSPDGSLLATASTDGSARVWVTGKGLAGVLIGHALGVGSVAFSEDGSLVATTSEDGTARLWAVDGDEIAVLAGHGAPVRSAAWSRDGTAVATTGDDGTLRIWYARAEPVLDIVRREPFAVAAARPAAGAGIVVAPRGAVDVSVAQGRYATADDRRVDVRRVADGTLVASFPSPPRVTGVALSPDASTVALATADGSVRLQRVGGGILRILRAPHALTRVAFSADGRLVAAGSTDHAAYVWNAAGGAPRTYAGHTDIVNSARFDSTGSLLVTASRDHQVRVWSVASRRTIRLLSAHFGSVADAGFSPDGRWVVTAGPGKAGLFDVRSGELLTYLQGHVGPLTSASFAGDGRTVVTSGSDGAVGLYRCEVCAPQAGLLRLAETRLAATGRTLTHAELDALGL